MTAPVGAAPSMLRPGQHAVAFPRATLKARTAHGPLGYPLSSSSSHDRRRVVPRKVSGSICRTLLVFRSSSPMCASLPRFPGGALGVCDARSSLGPFPRATLKARTAHGPLGYPLSSSSSHDRRRVVPRKVSGSICRTLLVLDRWGGQNARLFAKWVILDLLLVGGF